MKTKAKQRSPKGKSKAVSKGKRKSIRKVKNQKAIPPGATSRVVFFGPSFLSWSKGIEALDPTEREKQDLGKPVNRDEIKEMAVAYADQVKAFPTLDPNKEPMVLLLEKWEIKQLIEDPKCVRLKAMLAVEVNPMNNARHVTFVLMPCGEDGRVIIQGADPGRERWNLSILQISSFIVAHSFKWVWTTIFVKPIRI